MAHTSIAQHEKVRVISGPVALSGLEYNFVLPLGEYDVVAMYVNIKTGLAETTKLVQLLFSFDRNQVLGWGGRVSPHFQADTYDLMVNYNRKQIELV